MRFDPGRRRYVALASLVGALACLVAAPGSVEAQRGAGSSSVGGIAIDPAGLISNATAEQVATLKEIRESSMAEIPGDLKQVSKLRKVSLRRLEAAVEKERRGDGKVTDEVYYLAGLQRIRYVFVYPELNDIVIAGFAEGWKVDNRGTPVGITSGRPVMLLDDLMVALRTLRTSPQAISCSIDPTESGLQRLQEYAAKLTTIEDASQEAHKLEQLLGQQVISITGVPDTSHFARVMVSADYRMKRLGMKFEPAPVPGLPSYVDMIRPGTRGMQSMTPRWWLVPNYEPLSTDGDGLAWEIKKASVKCLTEETLFSDGGAKSQTGKVNPIAQQWATNFTNKYDDLSAKETIFGQLRNCMDLTVLAALIMKQDLATKAGYQLPLWYDDVHLPAEQYLVPRATDTQASFVKKGTNWIITASGGVQVAPGSIVDKFTVDKNLGDVRGQAKPSAERWWWD